MGWLGRWRVFGGENPQVWLHIRKIHMNKGISMLVNEWIKTQTCYEYNAFVNLNEYLLAVKSFVQIL